LASCLTAEYPNGVEYARQGIGAAPGYGINHAILAMNYVGLGEIDRARAAFEVAQRLSPSWVEQRLRGAALFRSPHDVRRATTFLKIAAGLLRPRPEWPCAGLHRGSPCVQPCRYKVGS